MYATTYYDETQISAAVDSNTRIVSYNKVQGDQTENLQDVNMTINKYITRLSSENSFKENVLSWDSNNGGGAYDYNIPYYKFTVGDQAGFVGSSPVNLVVTYSFSQQINNSWVLKRDWAAVPYDTNNAGGFYVIPISTEYLGTDLATVDNTVNNRVAVRIVDEAGNIGYKYFYFKLNLLGPPVITIYDPTLSASPYFTRSDSLYMYGYDARTFAYGRTLKAIGVVISNPNPVTVYVDPRNITGSVTVNKKVIAARGADNSTPCTAACGTLPCIFSGMTNYGAEYASKDYSYTINSIYDFTGGFRDVSSQRLIALDSSGYYPLLPGQTAVGYSNFDNYGYGVNNSGQIWNWRYGGVWNPAATLTNANILFGTYQWCLTDDGGGYTGCAFTSAPQFTLVDDYYLRFSLQWSESIYVGPYIQGVNTNNLWWYAGYNSNGASLANWSRTQLGTCTQYAAIPDVVSACIGPCPPQTLTVQFTRVCEDFAVNNANTSARVQQALP